MPVKKVSSEENIGPELAPGPELASSEDKKSNGAGSAKKGDPEILEAAASILSGMDAQHLMEFLTKINVYPFAYRITNAGKQVFVTPPVSRATEFLVANLARVVSSTQQLRDLVANGKAYMTPRVGLALHEVSSYFDDEAAVTAPAFASISRMSVILRGVLRESQYYATPPQFRSQRANFRGYTPPKMDADLNDLYEHEMAYLAKQKRKQQDSAKKENAPEVSGKATPTTK